MVKVMYCLHRLPNLSREEFQRYWRENHGPLVRKHQEALRARRYVQFHTFEDERRRSVTTEVVRPEPYDGVAELWWDSVEELFPENPTPERQEVGEILLEDEKNFIDLSRSPIFLMEEHVVIDDVPEAPLSDKPNPLVKQIICGHRLPNVSREEYQRRWRENHGPLVQKHKEAMRIRRYIQCHTKYEEYNEVIRERGNLVGDCDGAAVLWYDSVEDFIPEKITPEREQAGNALREDAQKSVDWSRSPACLGREYVFIAR